MMTSGEIRRYFPFTSIMVDASRTLHNPALHDYAKSPQYCEILAYNLMALLTLEPTLLQETLARMKRLLSPAVNVLYVPGSNIPNGVESFPIPSFPHQGTESDKTPYLNDIMPIGNEGFFEMDLLKHDTSANHDQREEGHQGLVHNTQSGVGFTFESRAPDVGEDPKRNTRCDDDLAISVADASYLTPKSNPSHTPKFTNSALKGKVRKSEKSRKRTKNQTASMSANLMALTPSEMCSGDSNEHSQLSSSDEAVRLDLLRSLAKKPIYDEELRHIYQAGDGIISDTGIILNDLKGWLLKDCQTYGISLPHCHGLPSEEIPATMFRFLMETNNDEQRKSVYRRLARVIFFVFVNNGVKQLERRDEDGETIHRRRNNLTTIFHKSILDRVCNLEINGEKCKLSQVSDSKNYGKRWWRLGSNIGIIAILTCGPTVASYIDGRSDFPDSSLELLVNYLRNAYPNAIAHFQLLDPILQPLFANLPMSTNQVVDLIGHIDPLYLKFSVLREKPHRVDTKEAMDTGAESLLQYFGHCN